jgi:hypothetical protein
MARVVVAFFCLLLGSGAATPERRVTLFYTGAIHGALEPCGCTSDPLGDIARMTRLVRNAADKGPVLLVDAGNLSYPPSALADTKHHETARLRAAFLASVLRTLPFGGSALGETDGAGGLTGLQPRRLAANLNAPGVVQAKVQTLGGIRIGVLGLAHPDTAKAHGLAVEDPVIAAAREAKRLRGAGAEVVIVLAPLDRPRARQVARGADVDFVVLGKDVGLGRDQAEQVGKAFLLTPAEEMQKVGRLELVLRPGPPVPRDAGGPQADLLRRQHLDRLLADLDAQLAAWQKDSSADPMFVADKRRERKQLDADRQALGHQAWRAPTEGSYFINQLIPVQRALPRDPRLAQALLSLNRRVGEVNLRRAQPPPKAGPGQARFMGHGTCAECHEEAMRFWKTTVHARAWHTLVVDRKTGHDDCVSCHVTGYGEAGGSSLGYTEKLKSVQCESCHGPGSRHVAEEGLEEPAAVRLATPASLCTHCHNEKHSDTFAYEPYLRDILGPGHGEKARARLGPGPTGHQLRQTALKRAKAAGEALAKSLQ